MKRLAIFWDGTWNTLNNNTNVWRLRSLTAETADQRVYYSQGVGTRCGAGHDLPHQRDRRRFGLRPMAYR
ncbi:MULTISPECIES: phospholipase effector Tle1 domain-containing protein [Bradyrhizobium]|uniref:phospholipase effector Tle1 domain-containing protein n=1 Tax=Bradyrhizobium TaxID=374 RepID=UPI0034E59FCD